MIVSSKCGGRHQDDGVVAKLNGSTISKGILVTLLLAMGFLIVTRAPGAGGEAKSESYFGTGILNNGFDKPLGQSFVGNANQRIP